MNGCDWEKIELQIPFEGIRSVLLAPFFTFSFSTKSAKAVFLLAAGQSSSSKTQIDVGSKWFWNRDEECCRNAHTLLYFETAQSTARWLTEKYEECRLATTCDNKKA